MNKRLELDENSFDKEFGIYYVLYKKGGKRDVSNYEETLDSNYKKICEHSIKITMVMDLYYTNHSNLKQEIKIREDYIRKTSNLKKYIRKALFKESITINSDETLTEIEIMQFDEVLDKIKNIYFEKLNLIVNKYKEEIQQIKRKIYHQEDTILTDEQLEQNAIIIIKSVIKTFIQILDGDLKPKEKKLRSLNYKEYSVVVEKAIQDCFKDNVDIVDIHELSKMFIKALNKNIQQHNI